MTKPSRKTEAAAPTTSSLAASLRAPRGTAHSGMSAPFWRVKVRSSSIETPLEAPARLSSFRTAKVSSAHGITRSKGSASYGYQIAAAAAEAIPVPCSAAKILTGQPDSASITPDVRPETPAPTIATGSGISLHLYDTPDFAARQKAPVTGGNSLETGAKFGYIALMVSLNRDALTEKVCAGERISIEDAVML